MNEQELGRRLTQAAGSLRPSGQASAEDLTKARKRLASCLLRGQTEDILPPVGYRFADPDRPAPEDLAMDATLNFSFGFAQASESKARLPARLPTRKTLERVAIGLSLIVQAFGFLIFGTLIIVNRHQVELNRSVGGSFIAIIGGISALLVGTTFLIVACLYWRSCARRAAASAVSRIGVTA